jgi:hypothetical protein
VVSASKAGVFGPGLFQVLFHLFEDPADRPLTPMDQVRNFRQLEALQP